jgi:hypothetical protein
MLHAARQLPSWLTFGVRQKMWRFILFTGVALAIVARVVLESTDRDALWGADGLVLWSLLLAGGISSAAVIHWRLEPTSWSRALACVLFAAFAISLGVYLWKGLSA